MNDAFIKRERNELNTVVNTMSNNQRVTLGNHVNRINYLLDLLEKSGLSVKQKTNIAHLVETQNDKVALSTTLMNNVKSSAGKHGQAQAISDVLSFQENSKPIPISKDLYQGAEVGTQEPQEPFNRRSFLPNPFNENTAQLPTTNAIFNSSIENNENSNLLSDSEIKTIKESSPEERHTIVKRYENQTHDDVKALDNHLGNMPYKMAGVGLLSGYVADKFVDNVIDPNKKFSQKARTATSGGIGGGLAEVGASTLTGEAIAPALVSSSAIGGIAGALAGESEYKYLKKKGVDELQSETGAGATAGGVFGATSSLGELGTAVGVGAEEGATAGLSLAGETAGLSVLGGSAIGATLAGTAYEISKAYNYLKKL